MTNERPTLKLSAPQIIGGALAAASAAVASSWLGVAGTVLGAVIVSLVASIGSAIYTHSLERSSLVIRETLPVVPLRTISGASARGSRIAVMPVAATAPLVDHAARRSSREQEPARTVPWRTVGVSALASLALAAAVLTGFELIVGKPASSIVGNSGEDGTTVSQLVGPGVSAATQDGPRPAAQPMPNGSESGAQPSPDRSSDQGQPNETSTTPTPTPTTPAPSSPTGEQTTPTPTSPTDEPTPTSGTPTP